MTSKLIISFAFLLISCSSRSDSDRADDSSQDQKLESKWYKKSVLFNDSSYLLTLTVLDTSNSTDIDKPTVIVNLLHIGRNSVDTVINDSLYSRNRMVQYTNELDFELIDFNFDGVKDIALIAGEDPRQNYGYHLYLVDTIAKTLKYVEGFQNIGNPIPDSLNQIIVSHVLSGQNFSKFYAFDLNDNIIDLGFTVTYNYTPQDSITFKRNLKKALKKKQCTT